MLKHKFVFFSSFFILSGCFASSLEKDSHVDQSCERHLVYPTEHRAKAVYVSPDHESYTAYIDYAKVLDFSQGGYPPYTATPKEVAELAYHLSVALEKHIVETENFHVKDNVERAKKELKNTHYIIHDKKYADSFYWMWSPDKFEENPEEARDTLVHAFFRYPVCHDHPIKTNVSTVYKSMGYFTPLTISHELTHAIGLFLFGSADSDHDNPNLWVELYEDSIQARALRMFEEAKEKREMR